MFQETTKYALCEEKEKIIEGFIGSSCIEGLIGGSQIADGVRTGCDSSRKEPELSPVLEDIIELYDPNFQAVDSIEMFQDHLEFMYDFWVRKVSIARLFRCRQQLFTPRTHSLARSFSGTC
jgi:hypothetical protein